MLKFFFDSGLHSPSNANEVVRYLEREAAEGSEGIETANARSTSTTPMDPRLARSVSQARSEPDAYSSVKLTPTSPLLPLEQLLMQQDPHDVSGTCPHIFLLHNSNAAVEIFCNLTKISTRLLGDAATTLLNWLMHCNALSSLLSAITDLFITEKSPEK